MGTIGIEIVILAGGTSARMGRDKARLRLGSRTLLGHVRATALATGWPVRVLRRDAVPRCGPVGGVCTALRRTRAAAVLFLACDMPFVTPGLLRAIAAASTARQPAVFCAAAGKAGFPFLIPGAGLPVVEGLLAGGEVSLQALARALGARRLRLAGPARRALFNVNAPEDWRRARELNRLAAPRALARRAINPAASAGGRGKPTRRRR